MKTEDLDINLIDESLNDRCIYCGSPSYGIGCPFGPKGVHIHLNNRGRCIYCGSPAMGLGCPINPHDKHHMHGIDYNGMIKESLLDGIITGYLMKQLSTPIKEWPAYRLGLINENGKLIKRPTTLEEKAAYNKSKLYILRLKKMIDEHNIELLNNSLYLIESNNDTSIDNIAELYKREMEIKEQINEHIKNLYSVINNAYQNGLNDRQIECMIIESINEI